MSTPCENCGSHIRVCADCDLYKGKYIEISDNATNGEVIKAMFPNTHMEYRMWTENLYFYQTDWWNAPYQKGGK